MVAYLTSLAQKMMSSGGWPASTIGDLYDVLLEMVCSTLADAVDGKDTNVRRFWLTSCKPSIDFLLYILCDSFGIVTMLLGIDMAVFREALYKEFPRIIEDRGAIKIGGNVSSF